MATTQIDVKLNFVDGSLTSLQLAVADKGITASFAFVPQSLLNLLSQFVPGASTKISDAANETLKPVTFTPALPNVEIEETKTVQVWDKRYEKEFLEFVSDISKGLENNYSPELCEDGVNGTYFLKNEEGEYAGVFKPQDEELASANNPKRSSSDDEDDVKVVPLAPGEAAQREVAAYLLDREGFFGVPQTAMVHLKFPDGTSKLGSLQQFIENDGASEDMGPSVFPTKEVHKIGILDLYMLNMDRHGGNILVKETDDGTYSLIPIDNGFSLPDTFAISNLWFEWMTWPQAKRPFDKETLTFIDRLDVEQDIRMLRQANLGIREECLEIMRITGHLLKKGAAAGLTLYQMGQLLCPVPGEESPLQQLLSSSMESTENKESIAHIPTAVALKHVEDLISSAR